MFGTFERGRILGKLIGAWILCSFAAVGAPNVQRDVASEENYRFKKDAASLSTEFQQILPVQVDFGSLVDSITQRISGIEGNVTDLGKQLESSEDSKARLEEEISRLKMQQKEILKNESREQKSLKEEISQLKEQLKSAEGQKLQTTAESNKITENRERTFVFIGEYERDRKRWDDAREECKRRGGDLATHLTEKDLYYVYGKYIAGNTVSAWVGGHMNARATESNFKESFEWVDGDRISADDGNWKSDEPTGLDWKCMYIYKGPSTRKDGTSGPTYVSGGCSGSSTGFLCEI